MIERIICWICFRLIMLDPRAPSGHGIRGWVLARAGAWAIPAIA